MSAITSPKTPLPDQIAGFEESGLDLSRDIETQNDSTVTNGKTVTRDTMTPPPSGQYTAALTRSSESKAINGVQNSLASPPATLKAAPPITSVGLGLFGEVPSVDSVHHMDEAQLRRLILELLPALGEARVTAAHSKLQHSLLAIEKEEESKRAEVEHEATRREVQVLQDASPLQRHAFNPESPHSSVQQHLRLALKHCRELQEDNTILHKKLAGTRKSLSQMQEENIGLRDRAELLYHRIKVNRDHLSEMQSSGSLSLQGTPLMDFGTPQARPTPRTPATSRPNQDLDSLLIATQIIGSEANSVPSTPTPAKPRSTYLHHMRGAHSLSSLPSTPNRSRPVTADHRILTPIDQATPTGRVSLSVPSTQTIYEDMRDRTDRDSTISASDNEEDVYQDEEIAGSQASQRATAMLRHTLNSSQERSTPPAPNTGKLLQGKISGQVKKILHDGEDFSPKRRGESYAQGDSPRSNKKAKLVGTRDVGLGIKDWSNNGR